jgi:N-acylneuraminate cytidylyltransferase/CMP-N,N'-diacetyllegionaminic acid synthase
MSDGPTVLVTICARGGSKGVPKKNIREVAGDPLIAHTIRQAEHWDRATDIIVSTDSDEIAAVAEEYGVAVPFRRPAEFATDEVSKLPAIRHAIAQSESTNGLAYDYVVDLSVAAPIRTIQDIENCLQCVHGTEANNAYTVTEAGRNPYFNMVELDEKGWASLSKSRDEPVTHRQEAPDVYEMNDSVYVFGREYVLEADSYHSNRTAVSEMPPERSFDIDRPIDLEIVDYLMTEQSIEYD